MHYLSHQLSGVMAIDPARIAWETATQAWRWQDISDLSAGLQQALAGIGCGPASQVGLILRTRPQQAAAVVSLIIGGQCSVTLNASLPDERLASEIARLGLAAVVAEEEDWARPGLQAAAETAGSSRIILKARGLAPELVRGSRPGPGPASEAAVLMLTSGTTGEPKRVALGFGQLETQLKRAARADPTRKDDDPPMLRPGSVIHHAPLVHISGLWGLLGAVLGGQHVYMMERFSVSEWRDAVVRLRPASAGGPPAVIRMIYDAGFPKEDLASLRALGTGTAGIDPDLVDAFLERYDLPVLGTYGATEFGGGVAGWSLPVFRREWKARRGAAGRMNPGCEARVIDPETGEVLPTGQVGLLELRAAVVGDGRSWVRTSDMARLDEDHFLWILGRADNVIIRGGFKIHPDEVAGHLQRHPAVAEAAIVGLPDARLGQVPAAALIAAAGAERPGEAELDAYLRQFLAAYCIPVAYRWVDELPRTPSMKVSTPGVRALFQ